MAKKYIIKIPQDYWINKYPETLSMEGHDRNNFIDDHFNKLSEEVARENIQAIILAHDFEVNEVDIDNGDIIEVIKDLPTL